MKACHHLLLVVALASTASAFSWMRLFNQFLPFSYNLTQNTNGENFGDFTLTVKPKNPSARLKRNIDTTNSALFDRALWDISPYSGAAVYLGATSALAATIWTLIGKNLKYKKERGELEFGDGFKNELHGGFGKGGFNKGRPNDGAPRPVPSSYVVPVPQPAPLPVPTPPSYPSNYAIEPAPPAPAAYPSSGYGAPPYGHHTKGNLFKGFQQHNANKGTNGLKAIGDALGISGGRFKWPGIIGPDSLKSLKDSMGISGFSELKDGLRSVFHKDGQKAKQMPYPYYPPAMQPYGPPPVYAVPAAPSPQSSYGAPLQVFGVAPPSNADPADATAPVWAMPPPPPTADAQASAPVPDTASVSFLPSTDAPLALTDGAIPLFPTTFTLAPAPALAPAPVPAPAPAPAPPTAPPAPSAPATNPSYQQLAMRPSPVDPLPFIPSQYLPDVNDDPSATPSPSVSGASQWLLPAVMPVPLYARNLAGPQSPTTVAPALALNTTVAPTAVATASTSAAPIPATNATQAISLPSYQVNPAIKRN